MEIALALESGRKCACLLLMILSLKLFFFLLQNHLLYNLQLEAAEIKNLYYFLTALKARGNFSPDCRRLFFNYFALCFLFSLLKKY